jgi:hypothetical protein
LWHQCHHGKCTGSSGGEPSDVQDEYDLRKKCEGEKVSVVYVKPLLFDSSLKPLPAPKKNVEKLLDTYTTIRPYVPSQYADDPLYTRPSNAGTAQAKTTKRARRELRAGGPSALEVWRSRRRLNDKMIAITSIFACHSREGTEISCSQN